MEFIRYNTFDILDTVCVNKICFNIDKTLISLATTSGYLVFSSTNFLRIINHNEKEEAKHQEQLGNLKTAIIYFHSELLFLVGEEGNEEKISNKEVVIYNDITRKKIGCLNFREDIKDVLVDKHAFFIILKNKILVFETISLKYICTLEDFSIQGANGLNGHLYTLSSEIVPTNNRYYNLKKSIKITNNSTLSYVSSLNPRQVKINKFKFEDGRIFKLQVCILVKDFKSIQYLNSDEKGEYIAVVNENGSKIRVYSTVNYKCKYKFWRGKADAKVTKLCFDDENKYIALISNTLTFHFYKLKKRNVKNIIPDVGSEGHLKKSPKKSLTINTGNHLCHPEEEEVEDESIFSEIFQDMVSLFSNNEYQRSFAQFRSGHMLKHIDDDIGFFNEFKEFVWLSSEGDLIHINFNKTKGGNCWISKCSKCQITKKPKSSKNTQNLSNLVNKYFPSHDLD